MLISVRLRGKWYLEMTNPNHPQLGDLLLLGLAGRRGLATKVTLSLVGLSVLATLGTGCSAQSTDSQPKKNDSKVQSEKKVELSSSEKAYAEYLKTLSPEQVALRESLNPDALARMSESEMTEAFTIKDDEVVVDGKLDIDLYAEAFTARYQAMANSGLSDLEYEKWGGLDNFGKDTIEKVSKQNFKIQSLALYGYSGVNEMNSVILTTGSGVDTLIKSGLDPQPSERYHYRMVVRPGLSAIAPSESVFEQGVDSYDARFSIHMSDNWEKETMIRQIGLENEPVDQNMTFNVRGLRVIEAGRVLPSSEITIN